MQIQAAVDVMMDSVQQNGLVPTIVKVFGKRVTVSLPISKRLCDSLIDDLDFSPRAINSLKRSGVFIVEDIVDLISGRGLLAIRNLGKKTENEIKTKILVYAYEDLSDGERRSFLADMIARSQNAK